MWGNYFTRTRHKTKADVLKKNKNINEMKQNCNT